MTKKSLANLRRSKLLKQIAELDPLLIYYICHLGDRDKFKSSEFDDEIDCRPLSEKWNLTIYTPSKIRKTHRVNCRLKRKYKEISNELINSGVCKDLKQIFKNAEESNQNSYVDRQKFGEIFWKRFTFSEDPREKIKNLLKKVETEFNIDLPDDGHFIYNRKGIKIVFRCKLENNNLKFLIEIECSCKERFISTFLLDKAQKHFQSYKTFKIDCKNCPNEYIISHNFFLN
ncbi:MAG: hypothetical protein GF353_25875 [Candidatus Lokiarchaeota archaeon]|nr:hypothetical protein [Candidatus Lokiarchaeota archaeon]